jgi:CEL-III-like protein
MPTVHPFLRAAVLLPLALAALCASASQGRADWSRCADEHKTCTIHDSGRNLIRYGANNRYFYLEVEGLSTVMCDNTTFGDPVQGTGKGCDYMEAPQPAPGDPKREITWRSCPTTQQWCALPSEYPGPAPHLVRLGGPQDWVYRVGAGGFSCNRAFFNTEGLGFWFNKVPYTCQYAAEPYASQAVVFKNCASEGQTCTTDGNVALLRFGRGDRWNYMIGSLADFPCNVAAFGDPFTDQAKSCQVAALPAHFTEVVGGWHEVQSCQGTCTLQKSIAVAVTGSRQKTVTTTWGEELSVAIEKSFGVPSAGGGKVSASFKVSHSEAVAVQESLSHQETKMQTVSCSPGKERSALYQWGIDADEMCYVGDGHCRSSVSTLRYLCAVDPPAGYRPVCAPEACADTLCTKCTQ